MRSPVVDHDQVPSLPDNIESQTHSRVSECDGRPSVQVKRSPVNRMVTASAYVQTDLSQVVHSSCRSFCHSPEPQSSTIRVSSPRPKCLVHRCSEHKLIGSHCLCLPSHGSPSQGDPKNQAIQLPDHCNSPRLARDALVLGPQLCVPQQSTASQPPRLVSRSGQLQEQGFSVEVAERIAAPQRSSTRTIYKSKWALFERWCRENSVDFSTPSEKARLRLLYVPAHPMHPSLQESIPGSRYWLPLQMFTVRSLIYPYVFNCIMYLVLTVYHNLIFKVAKLMRCKARAVL